MPSYGLLAAHGLVFMAGPLILVLGLVERFRKAITNRIWYALMVLFLLVAVFQVWEQEFIAREARDKELTAGVERGVVAPASSGGWPRVPVYWG